ncbi:protein of unknown function [Xenorhabdus poinarii G6]|uniref:Uncharacterized protein n=1 Tax=Xenorhabdus poinarii G6 TaxID=1354304 RepID=A0A068R9T1_9GAMM|nr:hypothetical protein [Xenorhabdus poinarii]CDG22950.1 protein of unknown function [Xenorhabdus poinarii G6]
MKDLALVVLETFHKEGLYIAVKNANAYDVVKEKISDHQYHYMKSVFQSLDENGQ